MNENKDKQIFTLDVVSSIDEDILDKNLKKRFALWKRRGKRRYLRVIPIIAAALCLCIGLGATVSFLFRGDEKQVPVYRGMTVSHDVPSAEEGASSLSAAAVENTALPTSLSRSALSLTGMPLPLSGTADADETSLPMLLDNDKNKNKEKDKSDSPEIVFGETYYAMKNEDIYIHIHLDNPDEFEILSFTLNGRKYSSNMFEYGSNLEMLIIKYNVGDAVGLQEYTIDAIKYVDGEKIKDVRMEGDQTVKVFLNDDQASLSFQTKLEGFDLVIEQLWAEEYTGDKTLLTLSLWEGEQKLRDLDVSTERVTDLPVGKRLILKATYMEGDQEKTVQHVFDSRAQSAGLSVQDGVVVGVGSCTDSVIYVDMPIAEKAFDSCLFVTEVYMGAGCTSVGVNAFSNCEKLTKVNCNEDLTELGAGAFFLCVGLKEIRLPESLTAISEALFSGCTALERIDFPDGVTRIESYAFHGCESLANIDLPKNLTFIGGRAFMRCLSLSEITIPGKVQLDNSGAFDEAGLQRVILEDGITEISAQSFGMTHGLQSIVIPKSVTKIGARTFHSMMVDLKYIEYQGSKEDWSKVSISGQMGYMTVEIRCTDGTLTYQF